jgi:hypothetical protein
MALSGSMRAIVPQRFVPVQYRYSRGSTGSLSRARTPSTHLWNPAEELSARIAGTICPISAHSRILGRVDEFA